MRLAFTNLLIRALKLLSYLGSLSGSSILDDVCISLDEDESGLCPRVIRVHLYPSDCPSVMVGMKNIITSLVERGEVVEVGKPLDWLHSICPLIGRVQSSASHPLQ